MDILIVYAGKTGTTEKCAGIIGQKLKNAKVVNLLQESPDIRNYDIIIIGGSVRYGRINSKARNFINKNKSALLGKKTAYYICCGFADGGKKYLEESIDKELLDNSVAYETFGGELDENKQKGLDKLVAKFVHKAIEDGKIKAKPEILYDNIDRFITRINDEQEKK